LEVDVSATGTHAEILSAVSGNRAGQVWAVGAQYEASKSGAVMQRWTGGKWQTASALPGSGPHELEDVAVLSSGNAWAVGSGPAGAGSVHWDGSMWRVVPTAQTQSIAHGDLTGVAAAGPHDVWAVGTTLTDRVNSPLIEHWDGTSWSLAKAPHLPSSSSGLRDVAVGDGRKVWAVGWIVGRDRVFRILTERWDGAAWSRVRTPPIQSDATLSSVAALGPDDVWAAGWSLQRDRPQSLLLHWDGETWRRSLLPGPEGARARVSALIPVGDGAVAVGQAQDSQGVLRPVAFRWDRSSWSQMRAAVGGSSEGGLNGVTSAGPDGLIAVGSVRTSQGNGSLVERGC